jgi:type I restriction enzyme M protein
MLNLYKEYVFNYSQDYEVLMLEVENVGYDATGKVIEGSELPKVAQQIKDFISKVL